jgi:hypothetical protein
MPATTHTGGCHCGQVRYAVTLDLSSTISCNCSICTKNGFVWAFAPAEQFRLDSGEGTLSEYTFNRHVIRHQFCRHCGTESFAYGKASDGRETIAVNVRCLDNIDLAALNPKEFDGRAL